MAKPEEGKARLADQLEALGDPRPEVADFIRRLREGDFNEFSGVLERPLRDLVKTLEGFGFMAQALGAMFGDYDATDAEVEAWVQGEGRAILSVNPRNWGAI